MARFSEELNATLDIGNTATKIGFFSGKRLLETRVFHTLPDLEELAAFNCDAGMISTVSEIPEQWVQGVKELGYQILGLEHELPIKNSYNTQETLGSDRLAAAVGATASCPNSNVLAIDVGTCLTYELVKDGEYIGGGISPGLRMRFKAMHTFTDQLPLVEPVEEIPPIGDTTQNAMVLGTQAGFLGEIDAMIAGFEKLHGPLNVIVTGGDMELVRNGISRKNDIFAEPMLVLIGLNEILLHNAQ